MYDLKIVKRAKLYVDAMSLGINPLTGQYVDKNDSLAQKRLQDCMSYVSEMLNDLITNDGKVRRSRSKFAITSEQKRRVTLSNEPIGINELAKRINAVIDSETMRTVSGAKIASWMVEQGYLNLVQTSDRRSRKEVNALGAALGISEVEGVHQDTGEIYKKLVYNKNAQQYILDHIEEAVKR